MSSNLRFIKHDIASTSTFMSILQDASYISIICVVYSTTWLLVGFYHSLKSLFCSNSYAISVDYPIDGSIIVLIINQRNS